LQAEQDRIDGLSMPADERDYLKRSWQGKLQRAGEGDQRWGLFSAVKAT
jgi:hypothetical protein